MSPTTFGERLQHAVRTRGPVVAGIDPHPFLLRQWELPDTPESLRTLGCRVLEAVDGHVAAVKPQSAFFERHGAAGIAVLEELLEDCRARGILSILDVKRGDIGSTMGGYAEAYLRPGAALESDAITLSPFLGAGSLDPALDLAAEHGKGAFVLALTSNPDGAEVQHARDEHDRPVARRITEVVQQRNAATDTEATAPARTWGSIGLVVGATVGDAVARLGIDLEAMGGPVLAPGFGAQGAGPGELTSVFGGAAPRVLVSVSRALLGAGPDLADLRTTARELAAAYTAAT
ncbi:MAG: orotidine-5'-phosphate decarboxylase [Brachybacterium sp.]|nr:orotidine-5'-phosphate decarboxylase [Brachybacterium sp.]